MIQAEDFSNSQTLIANVVFNVFLSCTAIILNIITIHALRKMSSLPKTLKTLLLNLAVSDLGVGLLVQPFYISLLVMEMEQNTINNTYNIMYIAYLIPAVIFSTTSFFGIFALTADSFLAIHLHLRYQELVTHKRVVAAMISIWVFTVLLSLTNLDWSPEKVRLIIFLTFQVVCYVTTGFLYYKIYATVRYHINQIHALQVQQVTPNGEMTNAARLRKTAVSTFYVYLVFLACHLPTFCTNVALFYRNLNQNILLRHLQYYALTLVYLNSSLNPLIYCWKMNHIRHAVVDILRNVLPRHH